METPSRNSESVPRRAVGCGKSMLPVGGLMTQHRQDFVNELARRQRRNIEFHGAHALLLLQRLLNFRIGALKKKRSAFAALLKYPIGARLYSESVAQINRQGFGHAERYAKRQKQRVDYLPFVPGPIFHLRWKIF